MREKRSGAARRLPWVLLVLAALLAPRPSEARMQMTVEAGSGVSVPLGRYIDVSGKGGHNRIDNGLHASLNLSLLFGNWTFHYNVNWISLGKQDLQVPAEVFQQYEALSQAFAVVPELRQLFNIPDLPTAATTKDLDSSLAFHSLGFGYRIYLMRGTWQPYIPIELGAAIVTSDKLSRTLYGLTASTGIGLDVRVWRFIYLGMAARYSFYLTETDQFLAAMGLATTSDIFDATVAMGHVVSVTANLQVRY